MNILLAAEDLILNGVTRHIIDLGNGLASNGHKVFVASTPSDQRDRLNPLIQFIPLSLCKDNSYKKQYQGIPSSIATLLHCIRQNQLDIIHTHKRYMDILGRITARLTNIIHIATCHNEFTNHRLLSRFGDITIAPCPEIEHMLKNVFRISEQRIKSIYYGIRPIPFIDADAQKVYRDGLGISSDVKIILSVGHLNRQKDRGTLIEAIRLLKERHYFKNAICIIVGEGEEQSTIQQMIQRHDLNNEVLLFPARSDVSMLNNIADFCVLSSIHEGAPHVILEAASVGKPFVATSVGFIPGFIEDDRTGIRVPARNPNALAEGIRSLLMDSTKVSKLGQAAYDKFMKCYSYDRFIQNTIALYEQSLIPKT